jgi:hypothetical protein
MWNPSQPPVAPTASREVLLELAAYYRQLTEYHQRSAAIAAQQLAHVEVLLNSSLTLDRSWDVDNKSLLTHSDRGNTLSPDLRSVLEISSLDATVAAEASQPSVPNNSNSYVQKALFDDVNAFGRQSVSSVSSTEADEVFDLDKAKQAIEQLLIDNRHKILRLDYIVQKLYGHLNISGAEKEQLQDKVKQILIVGESQRFWYAVPDSPDCWTIELEDIPDLAPTSAKGQKKSSLSNSGTTQPLKKQTKKSIKLRSRLAYSEKLENVSLVDAVAECLQENYPMTMTANEVVRWLYPNGLPEEDRKQARSSVSDTLNKRCDSKGWRRVNVGVYVWDEEPN